MNILFDENFPRPLRHSLAGHTVKTAQQMGWAGIENGGLLDIAQSEFDILLTTDKGIKYQQNFTGRDIALLPTVQPGRVYIITTRDEDGSAS